MSRKIFFILSSIASGLVHELALWLDDAGEYTVDARAMNCNRAASPSRRFPIKVTLYDFSVIEEQYTGCEISFPSLSGRELRFRDGFVTGSYLDGFSVLGLGPGSPAANNGLDIIVSGGPNTPAVMRIGSSDSQFESLCYPGTLMGVPTRPAGAMSDISARFDLVNSSIGVRFNTTDSPEPVALEFVAQHSLASFPESLASRLDDILISSGATRTTQWDWSHWTYSNCSISNVPNLVIDFYGGSDDVFGSIILTPEEFMPQCEFHVAEEGLMPALDILKLPYINKRIGNNEIYLCDSPIAF